jgi:aryl-alcohol dehydrogenase-like predicted oxidoreductase
MEFRNLGRSGLKVSRACLGAMNFGTGPDAPTSEADARTIIDAFLDTGNNFIDTANIYTSGQSEEVVGRAIRHRRDSVVLATKGYGPIGSGPNDMGLSRNYLTRALDASLKRLGTEYVDLYQCHRPDPSTPVEETMDTLTGFVRAGKVRYIGVSNWTGSQIVEAQWAASRTGGAPLTSLQPQYSLVARDIETDILPACGRHGLGTLIYSPLGGGILTGKYSADHEPEAGTRFARASMWAQGMMRDRNFEIAEVVKQVAAELDATPSAVAIAWCLTRDHVTSVIIGPRTLAQMQDNLTAFDLVLPPQALKRLSDASKPAQTGLRLPRKPA